MGLVIEMAGYDTIKVGDVKITFKPKSKNRIKLIIDAPKEIPVLRLGYTGVYKNQEEANHNE